MILVQLMLVAAGLGSGIAFALIWSTLSQRLGPETFWASYKRVARQLLFDEDAEFLAHYAELLRTLLPYLGRTLLKVALASAPAAIFAAWFGLDLPFIGATVCGGLFTWIWQRGVTKS